MTEYSAKERGRFWQVVDEAEQDAFGPAVVFLNKRAAVLAIRRLRGQPIGSVHQFGLEFAQ